jgi:hypothetical protein
MATTDHKPNGTLSEIDKKRISLRTAHDMQFVLSKEKGIGTIPRFTKCVKPAYTRKIRKYLDNMEERGISRPVSNPKAVAVKLLGLLRYVWRTDVLTKEEYDAIRKKERSALGVLRQEPKRPVGEVGANDD